jgi:hypothetical protein
MVWKKELVILMLLACSLQSSAVAEQRVTWSLYEADQGGNGHQYMAVYVPGGISWTDANTAAQAAGDQYAIKPHLVTITSSEENDFVYKLISDDKFWHTDKTTNRGVGPWLGAHRVNGNFEWVTGEDFSSQTWAWVEGQPDNYGEKDDYLMFAAAPGIPKSSKWDDVWGPNYPGWTPTGYIVEWDTNLRT